MVLDRGCSMASRLTCQNLAVPFHIPLVLSTYRILLALHMSRVLVKVTTNSNKYIRTRDMCPVASFKILTLGREVGKNLLTLGINLDVNMVSSSTSLFTICVSASSMASIRAS